jgi:hypothetical protein
MAERYGQSAIHSKKRSLRPTQVRVRLLMMKASHKPVGRLVAVNGAIHRFEQMEHWAGILRLTAPRAKAELGDLSRRMRPTPSASWSS